MKRKCLGSHIVIIFLSIIFLLLYLMPNFAYALENNRRKILLICLDGATWNIIDPLIEKSRLPNFSKLIKNGVYGKLFSDQAFSPPSWTSIATGKRVEKHGINNFSDIYVRKARFIWGILSDFNIKVGIINWLMSMPEKINGIMYNRFWIISGEEKCYPDIIKTELKRRVNIIKELPFELVEGYRFWNIIDKNTMNISLYLIKKYCPSFVAIGFMGTNPYQHRYWSALEPQYFDITLEEAQEKGNLIIDYYKKIDNFLDYFIKNNYTIIFISDHGFCRNDIRSGPRIVKYYHLNSDMQHINFLANKMLEKMGLLVFVPKLEGGGQINFTKSKAYFYNNIKLGIWGIRLNRKIVKEEEIASLRERIYLLLKEAHFNDGERVFINVKENILDKYTDMPDVIFDLNPIFKKENFSFKEDKNDPTHLIFNQLLNKDGEKLTKISLEDKEYDLGGFIDYSRDGVHEHEGVIIMMGKNIRRNKLIKDAKEVDVVPTILYLLDLPIAKDMDGRVLIEAIEPEFIAKEPIKYIDTYEISNKDSGLKEDIGEEEIIKERLHSLGYAQ